MASFTGKPMKDVYKDILHTDNSNSGLSTTIKQIKCGDGDATARVAVGAKFDSSNGY